MTVPPDPAGDVVPPAVDPFDPVALEARLAEARARRARVLAARVEPSAAPARAAPRSRRRGSSPASSCPACAACRASCSASGSAPGSPRRWWSALIRRERPPRPPPWSTQRRHGRAAGQGRGAGDADGAPQSASRRRGLGADAASGGPRRRERGGDAQRAQRPARAAAPGRASGVSPATSTRRPSAAPPPRSACASASPSPACRCRSPSTAAGCACSSIRAGDRRPQARPPRLAPRRVVKSDRARRQSGATAGEPDSCRVVTTSRLHDRRHRTLRRARWPGREHGGVHPDTPRLRRRQRRARAAPRPCALREAPENSARPGFQRADRVRDEAGACCDTIALHARLPGRRGPPTSPRPVSPARSTGPAAMTRDSAVTPVPPSAPALGWRSRRDALHCVHPIPGGATGIGRRRERPGNGPEKGERWQRMGSWRGAPVGRQRPSRRSQTSSIRSRSSNGSRRRAPAAPRRWRVAAPPTGRPRRDAAAAGDPPPRRGPRDEPPPRPVAVDEPPLA